LLYCALAISPHNASSLDLSFAFPHAVNLAEAGVTMQERSTGMLYYPDWVSELSIVRPGYLFCKELLPQNHDLQLMLVNTIRKVCFLTNFVNPLHELRLRQDLESGSVPRIVLSLDALIQSPSAEVMPAVQRQLYDLLSHPSSVCTLLWIVSYPSNQRLWQTACSAQGPLCMPCIIAP
jgi:AP-4 complex subunit epsilon-1